MFATWGCRPCCCSCRVYKGTFPKGWERTNGDDKEQERADDEHHVASHGALVGLVRMILPGPDSCHLISENTPEWWTPPEFVQFAIFNVQIVFTKTSIAFLFPYDSLSGHPGVSRPAMGSVQPCFSWILVHIEKKFAPLIISDPVLLDHKGLKIPNLKYGWRLFGRKILGLNGGFCPIDQG